MMSTTAPKPATTPIPVQLSEPEFEAFILPHLSMPKRGPKCKLGYYRVFNLILWVLYTGMQWKCVPVPTDAQGKQAIHYTTVYKVFAKWADDGSLWQAFVASVRHLAKAKKLDLRVLHGDGTNTVAKKGAMASAIPATNTRRARRSLPLSTIMALCERLSQWLPSMRQTWSCCRRACTR
jgi:transposase